MAIAKNETTTRELKKGDIVRNISAGENNPLRYLMYLCKGSVLQGRYIHNSCSCLAYDGRRVTVYTANNSLEYVGHIDEFDAFISALKQLRGVNDG